MTCNVILQHNFLGCSFVEICDNSMLNVRHNTKPNTRFYKHDNVHLNGQGIQIFASNLKDSICQALLIERKKTYDSHYNQASSQFTYRRPSRYGPRSNYREYYGYRNYNYP